jgi:hypothetical protein
MNKQNKIKTSFTLQPQTIALIAILAEKLSISKTAVITLAVLRFAESEKVENQAG